ncbi:MAG: hypothetical protein ACLP0J_16675 [Solirubrobacteraceae bacterium]
MSCPPVREGMVMGVVEVPLAAGGSILVEVDEPAEGPVVRGRSGAAVLPPLAEPLGSVRPRAR